VSLLSALKADRVEGHPFPHIVATEGLEPAFVRQLERECPPFEVLTRGRAGRSNQKFLWAAHRALRDPALSATWRRLFRELVAPESWGQWLRLFRAQLLAEYPDFEARFGRLDALRIGVRDVDDGSRCDVLLDAKIVAHAPVAGPATTERGPHVKILRTLFYGYLYLGGDADGSASVDHVLYSIRPGVEPAFDDTQATDPAGLHVQRVVPYRRGTLIALMNSPRSIQGLTARAPSPRPMLAFHFTAHVRAPLFDLKMKPGARPIRMEDARWYKRSPRSLLAGAWRRAAALAARA